MHAGVVLSPGLPGHFQVLFRVRALVRCLQLGHGLLLGLLVFGAFLALFMLVGVLCLRLSSRLLAKGSLPGDPSLTAARPVPHFAGLEYSLCLVPREPAIRSSPLTSAREVPLPLADGGFEYLVCLLVPCA